MRKEKFRRTHENEDAVPSKLMQVAQNGNHLSRKWNDEVIINVGPAIPIFDFLPEFHAPLGSFEINILPLRCSQFLWSNKQQRSKLQCALDGESPNVTVQRPKDPSEIFRFCDCSNMPLLRLLEGASKIPTRVAFAAIS